MTDGTRAPGARRKQTHPGGVKTLRPSVGLVMSGAAAAPGAAPQACGGVAGVPPEGVFME
jgi:hypothetical protein